MPSPSNKPFPWSILLWPIAYVVGWLAEKFHDRMFLDIDPETWEPPRATFRLWDEDYNLLASWEEGPIPLYVTRDYDGHRVSGRLDGITVVCE